MNIYDGDGVLLILVSVGIYVSVGLGMIGVFSLMYVDLVDVIVVIIN